ncbi:NrfD/PsrC family molybdoenzyme membrane anchor subunit [Bacillaceae bacterium S4-13-56]
MAWGTIIAWYLFLAGLSAGAYLTAYVVSNKSPLSTTIQKTGYFLAPALLGIGLLLLVFDAEAGLKDPLRFIYLFVNFPSSMMTNGTIILSIFMMIALFKAVMLYFKKNVPKIVDIIGVIFAVGTAAYTGLLIGVVKAVPLWNTSILPILFVVSAMSTGIAATVLLASLVNRHAAHGLKWLKKTHLVLLALEVLIIFFMFYVTMNANEVAYLSIKSIITGNWSLLFWLGLMLFGLGLPMLIEGIELLLGRRSSKKQSAEAEVAATSTGVLHLVPTVVTEAGVLVGGFILRYILLAAAISTSIFL